MIDRHDLHPAAHGESKVAYAYGSFPKGRRVSDSPGKTQRLAQTSGVSTFSLVTANGSNGAHHSSGGTASLCLRSIVIVAKADNHREKRAVASKKSKASYLSGRLLGNRPVVLYSPRAPDQSGRPACLPRASDAIRSGSKRRNLDLLDISL